MRSLLIDAGRIEGGWSLRPEPGGVSSTVVTVDDPAGGWVAKAPLRRLAVADEWYADPRRGLREAAVLRHLAGRIGPLRTPRLRFCDAGRLVIGMELIPPPAPSWKDRLLCGVIDAEVARLVGEALTALHRLDHRPLAHLGGPAAAHHFEQLRVDPYYRTAARRAPALARALEGLVRATTDPGLPRCLIHADLNPKNVLVTPAGPVLIDWELAHVGDPAFDLAMPVAHLLLKAVRRSAPVPDRVALLEAAGALWAAYCGPADRDLAVRHVGGIMAARLWGKSPVEYLTGTAERAAAEQVAGLALRGGTGMAPVLSAAVAGPGRQSAR